MYFIFEKNRNTDKYCHILISIHRHLWTSLVVQWVRLHAPNAEGLGSIPGQGTRTPMHAATKSPHAKIKRYHMLQ